MTWLRVDDNFTGHAKITELTDREFRVWVRTLCYCARHRTGGHITKAQRAEIAGMTAKVCARFHSLGLFDEQDDRPGTMYVHDWAIYNGATLEERVSAFLDQNPDVSANEVHKSLGGKREAVLSLVSLIRAGSPDGSLPGSKVPLRVVP